MLGKYFDRITDKTNETNIYTTRFTNNNETVYISSP